MKLIRARLTLLAAVVFISPGCVKRVALDEPADPTGPDPKPALTLRDEDPLPKLLDETVLHFELDDATLTGADMAQLKKLAAVLDKQPWAAIRIAGHCDERGTEEYNLALGQKRADAARSYLLALGISAHQVETITFGEEVPLIPASTDEALSENRRAEFGPAPLELFGLLDEESAAPAPTGGQP